MLGVVVVSIQLMIIWQHVVYVIDSGTNNTHKIYVDNEEIESQSISYFPSSVVRFINWIGSNGSTYLDGIIKSFNIWERALNATEINTLYNYGRNNDISKFSRFY